MTKRRPDFDIDQKIGAQSELWVGDIREAIHSKSIEVKAPKPFLKYGSFYVEYMCLRKYKGWQLSGIATTKAAVQGYTFGSLPGGLFVETEWVKRAARLAFKDRRNHRECIDGSNPTKGVVVSLADLWATKERDP